MLRDSARSQSIQMLRLKGIIIRPCESERQKSRHALVLNSLVGQRGGRMESGVETRCSRQTTQPREMAASQRGGAYLGYRCVMLIYVRSTALITDVTTHNHM